MIIIAYFPGKVIQESGFLCFVLFLLDISFFETFEEKLYKKVDFVFCAFPPCYFFFEKRLNQGLVKTQTKPPGEKCNPRQALSRVFIRTYPQTWWTEQCDLVFAAGGSNPACVCIQGRPLLLDHKTRSLLAISKRSSLVTASKFISYSLTKTNQ